MDLKNAEWRKASRSTNNGGNCVEVASVLDVVALRDSKKPSGGRVLISRDGARELSNLLKSL